MTIHIHRLHGCAPQPLAHYLKALGVLRLVAEQKDAAARAFWKDDVFVLATALDEAALSRFFLDEYVPTPMLTPWNGGSGFYPKDAKQGIDAIAASTALRFQPYREAIASAKKIIGVRAESPKKEEKTALLQDCRRTWTGRALDWLNAAVVLSGEDGAQYPALLGTGGNDGRLDFTNNQMQRLIELLDPTDGAPFPVAEGSLEASLFGRPAGGLLDRAIGQFLPGGNGINPWDFVLMLEGAILFQVAAVRRLDGAGLPQAAAPFAVRGQAGGYGSACAADESARGEQWMPLWSGPASIAEVRGLFAEGRLQSGAGRAHKALDAARAVARVGVARGVSEFVRFGYIERNGQANLAVPLGRWPVQIIPDAQTHLLDEIDPWVDNLRRASRSNTAPASVGRTLRVIEAAMLAVCRGSSAERWQHVLLALADAEDLLTARPKATVEARLQPIPRLSPEWLIAAGDADPEVRIAKAIASQTGPFDRRTATLFGPVRAHCLPLDPASGFTRFAAGADALLRDPRVVWTGRDLASDLGQIALRRVIEHQRFGSSAFPLHGRAFAPLDDITLFLDGALDEARIAGLARAFMAIDWPTAPAPSAPPWPQHPSAIHAVFRLAYAPERVIAREPGTVRDREYEPRCDPAPIRLLLAGQLDAAAKAALARLGTRGVRSKIRLAVGSAALAARLAASLAIPVAPRDLGRLLLLIDKPRRALAELDEHTPSLPAADPPSEPLFQE
jgi:CRISPR-associated protein Csx17